ncbi:hypothetical protein CDD83_5347 [Cordyceps sp. RAO-2017]|nr:hypothetical protein CDD83_5347 [Cordyceps sp. RAO-2017]
MDTSTSGKLGLSHNIAPRVQKPGSPVDQMAALKARVAAAIGTSKAKGGLNIGLHPALEDISYWKPPVKSRVNSAAHQNSQFKLTTPPTGLHNASSERAGSSSFESGRVNPYFDDAFASHSNSNKRRESRRLVFNQKGKYIQQGSTLRRQAALEAMKKRIAEQTRKVGIDDDLDIEKNFVLGVPPEIEWWDEGLVDGQSYGEADIPTKLKVEPSDSIVTEYVQHPVALNPAQDQYEPPAKPMFLTSKEQAKLRRQRRMAQLKEMQAKIRLGLIAAPPSKVKKGNLMRVLGDVAVKDPTAVEARVNREITERQTRHVQTNQERQLTKEQKHEKRIENQQKDADRGIHVLVFKIASLANGQHRYKITVNADQLALSGVCIMHPKFSLVIVEGGIWSVKKYRKLMLHRIDWTENTLFNKHEGDQVTEMEKLQARTQAGPPPASLRNECVLIFQGEQKSRVFRKWSTKVCDTDAEARNILARAKMENFWTLAKSSIFT